MTDSKIQWTDSTWNPVRGCQRVSAGCENCYAERQAYRFGQQPGSPYEGLTELGKHGPRWTGNARFVPEMLDAPLRWRRSRRVFVNSMSDLFHEDITNEQIAAVFGVMASCPQHTFQVLTKRRRMLQWFEWLTARVDAVERAGDGKTSRSRSNWFLSETVGAAEEALDQQIVPQDLADAIPTPWPLPNVWVGVSVENQEMADERIPMLLQCPAAVHFVSAEPLLGRTRLDQLGPWRDPRMGPSSTPREVYPFAGTMAIPDCDMDCATLDWVIVGGESGPGARTCNVEWIRGIVQQCEYASVPCFVKQLGARPFNGAEGARCDGEPHEWAWLQHHDRKGGDPSEWPADLRVRQFPEARP